MLQHNRLALVRLRLHWGGILLFYLFLLWLGYEWLSRAWSPGPARWWGLMAAGVLAYGLGLLWYGLEDNRRQGEKSLLPGLGAGNLLTLLRGLAIGLLAGFLFLPRPIEGLLAWMPAILYTLLSILDYVDGYVARVTNQATVLGERLDGAFDALGLLVAVGLAVWYGQLPGWYLLLGLSKYLFLIGLWGRRRQGKPIYDLPPSHARRNMAGFQMGFITVILWPLFSPPGTTLAGLVFAVPLLAGFLRDWLVVSGRLDPASKRYQSFRRSSKQVVQGWLPVLLRGMLVAASLYFLWPIVANDSARHLLLAWPGSPWPYFTADLLGGLAVLTTLMVGLGVLGRVAALGLLAPTAMTVVATDLHLLNGFLLAGTIALMLLGSGRFSLWQPEEAVISRRAGEKRLE